MSSSDDFEERRGVIIVKVPHFSDKDVDGRCASQEYGSCESKDFFGRYIKVEVYTNGIPGENEGYVSVILIISKFLYDPSMRNFEFSCVVDTLDASGEMRYPKSYVFSSHPQWNTMSQQLYHSLVLTQILKRDTLLGEPDDLLPDDCLTLNIDVIVRSWSFEPTTELEVFVKDSFVYGNDGEYVVLKLDSNLAKHLIQESSYFRLMSETPMVEKQRGYTIFRGVEIKLFRKVCLILEGVKNLDVLSADYLRQIYATADKYDIPVVIESCRGVISTLLRVAENDPVIMEHIAEDVPLFLELAHRCDDVQLKEIVETFIQRTSGGGIQGSEVSDSTRDRSEGEWRLEKVGIACSFFVFARGTPEETNFGFYQ